MRMLFVTVLSMALAGCSASQEIAAPQASVQAQPGAAFLADTRSTIVTAASSKRTYQISVALPDGYTKEHAPYPVFYMADANAEFGIVVETARLLSFSKDIPDLVIVGIGYPSSAQGFKSSNAARTLDLTPTADPAWLSEQAKASIAQGLPVAEASGGAPEFLRFIRNELVPSIEKTYNVSHQDRSWFGHSFGGLFGIYVLLNNDGLFKRFIIGSPSIWWNSRAILAIEDSFAATRKPLPARVFFAVGLLEEKMGPQMPMVGDLRAFTARLKRRNYQGFEFQTHFFADEDHGSVIGATVSRGLRFVYSNR